MTDATKEKPTVTLAGAAPHDGDETVATRLMPLGIGAVYVGACAVVGLRYGFPITILLLASAALLSVIVLTFRAVSGAIDSNDDDVVPLDAAPTPAEARKGKALQALRDLDYERGIGNVGDDDYATLRARYREEAREALRALDVERADARAAAEQLIAARRLPESAPPAAEKKAAKTPNDATPRCAACKGANDIDARFCKHCGKPIEVTT